MENQSLTSISQAPSVPTSMTSLEIATVTGKQHKNVLRDIDNLLEDLGSELSRGFKSSTYLDSNNTSRRLFVLDRDSTYCLMAGYDGKARMKIIKRWQELETRALASPSAEEMEARILARVMEQVKPLLDAPKQTRKRLPAPKKEFLPVDMLAQRHKLHLLLPAVGSMHFSYQDVAMHVLREQGLAEGTFIAPAPTEKAKGQYRLTRGRSPKLEWDAEDFKRAAEKTFNRTL